MIGDIANSIWQLNESLEPQAHWNFQRFSPAIAAMRAHVAEGSEDDRFPMYPQRLVADVRKAMPDDGIIALDNGVYKIWFARNYAAKYPNTVLLDNALATMGAGLPSAMAAKMVFPDRKVMAICGDGGFMMNSQELETAVRLKLDLIILILNDSAYGMIRWKQANLEFSDFGLEFANPCFKKYAESYGAKGYRVESASELLPLIKQCHQEPGVHLIDIPVDYSENDQILNRDLPRLSKDL
jgi:acetolactate synthase-1/2/3 large subunit